MILALMDFVWLAMFVGVIEIAKEGRDKQSPEVPIVRRLVS